MPTLEKKTIPERIIEVLSQAVKPLATHEFPFIGTNEPTISARLREMAIDGKVMGFRRKDKKFKEWILLKG
jgi:hypothetical protein